MVFLLTFRESRYIRVVFSAVRRYGVKVQKRAKCNDNRNQQSAATHWPRFYCISQQFDLISLM